MRIAAVSDLHGHLPVIAPCDLLLVAGDICPSGDHSFREQFDWLTGPFRRWLGEVPADQIVGVAGNHDFIFERHPTMVPPGLRWHYLQDSWIAWDRLKVYGLPWQPRFYDWAFNADPPQMERVAAQIPDDTDILVMHGPPRGFGDRARRPGRMPDGSEAYEHAGCPHLLDRVAHLQQLKLCVFGHIHSGHGVYPLHRTGPAWGSALLANVSVVDERYDLVHGATLFDYDPAAREVTRHDPPADHDPGV